MQARSLFAASCSSSSSSSTSRCVAVAGRSGLMSRTRVLRRPQTIKPNPNEAVSGQFDRSFEKMTATIEERLPLRQRNVLHGSLYDTLFGEESEQAQKEAAQDDIHGREAEKPAARQARSYFSDADLSPEALHVRSPRLKVAMNQQRLKYDKSVLKTTKEAPEYYYAEKTLEEKQRRRMGIIGVCLVLGGGSTWALSRLGAYMRTAG